MQLDRLLLPPSALYCLLRFNAEDSSCSLGLDSASAERVAWFAGRPALHRYQERRALRVATAFAKRMDLNRAWPSLQRALALNPTNVQACQLAAELSERTRSPAA